MNDQYRADITNISWAYLLKDKYSNLQLVVLFPTVLFMLAVIASELTYASESGPSGNAFWPQAENQPVFVFGKTPPNIEGNFGRSNDAGKNRSEIQYLTSVMYLWSLSSSLNPLFTIGCVPGDDFAPDGCLSPPDTTNDGRNLIMFSNRPPNGWPDEQGKLTLGVASPQTSPIGGTVAPRNGSRVRSTRRLEYVHIFIRPLVWATYRDPDNCAGSHGFVERVLAHEIGHALGLHHDPDGSGSNVMAANFPNRCPPEAASAPAGIMRKDRDLLRDYYGPFDQVDVSLTSPVDGFKIFPSATAVFEAAVGSRANSGKTDRGSISLTWEVDGREVASGESVEIDADEFAPGGQEVSVLVRSSTGAVLGSDSITVEKVTDLFVDDDFIVFPVPCINLAGSFNNRCMLRLKETWISGQCPFGFFDHDISAKDTLTNRNFSVIKPSYDQSPWGTRCEDNTSYDLFYGIWAVSDSDRFFLRFDHDVFLNGQWRNRNTVTGLVHKTDPVLEEFSIPGSCQIATDEARCAVDISWSGHYFAPSSALFFRRDGSDSWEKVVDMGLGAGSLRTENIVPFSGGQFAVFQYGSDFRVPSSSIWRSYRNLISAPAGLLAGPFTVQASIASGSSASPESGLWGNSVTDGTGVSLTSSSNGTRLLIWLTYENDGKAVWYMSQPAVETDGIFSAPLEKITWSDSAGSIRRTVVGNVAYAALTNDRMIFDWELDDGSNESTGSEILTHTVGDDSPTGFWNESGVANGRGFVMHSETLNGVKQNFLAILTYSGKGKPRWQFGGTAGSLIWHTRMDINENRRTVVCSTCEPVEYRLDAHPVGQLTAEFNGTATGWVNVQNLDNGEWIRGNSLNPVIFGQLTQ